MNGSRLSAGGEMVGQVATGFQNRRRYWSTGRL